MSRKKKKSPDENPAETEKKQSPPKSHSRKKTTQKRTKSSDRITSRWDVPTDDDDDDLALPSYGSFLNELDYDADVDWEDEKENQKTTSTDTEKPRKKSRRKNSKKRSNPDSKSDQSPQEKTPFFDEDDDDDDLTLPSYGRSHRPVIADPQEDLKKPQTPRKKGAKFAERKPVERKSVEQKPEGRKKESTPKKENVAARSPSAQSGRRGQDGRDQDTRNQDRRGDNDQNRPKNRQATERAPVKKEDAKPKTAGKPDKKTVSHQASKPERLPQKDRKPQENLPPKQANRDKTSRPKAVETEKPVREKEIKSSQKPAVKSSAKPDQKKPVAKEKQPDPNSRPVSKQQKQSKPEKKVSPQDRKSQKTSPPGAKTAFRFGQMKLSQQTLKALEAADYLEPTPVQEGVIPLVMQGKDVMGQARTGTGKTAAFLIPILEGLDECGEGNEPVALILVPTRELAVQVRDEGEKLAQGRDVRLIACYGGKPISDQIRKLKSGADIVVGTPGRILDLASRKVLSFDSLFWVVLDEADRMLDIGFRPDIEKILRQTPSDRQTLLLSATLPSPVVKLAERYMQKPEVVDFSDSQVSVETIEQYYITVDRERKFAALVQLLNQEKPTQAIIFCRTKRGVDRIYRMLEDRYKGLASLHSDMAQSVRDRVMGQFRSGKLTYLVATDVIGRGIDVSGISHIINYDIPSFSDDYVHRVGRTGRMGREGVAYTLVTAEEGPELTRIEMRINRLLKRAELKGFQAVMQVEKEEETAPAKPVFGKTARRIRRAL